MQTHHNFERFSSHSNFSSKSDSGAHTHKRKEQTVNSMLPFGAISLASKRRSRVKKSKSVLCFWNVPHVPQKGDTETSGQMLSVNICRNTDWSVITVLYEGLFSNFLGPFEFPFNKEMEIKDLIFINSLSKTSWPEKYNLIYFANKEINELLKNV